MKKTLFLLFATLLSTAAFAQKPEANAPLKAPAVVTPPSGLTTKEYPIRALLNGSTDFKGKAYVGIDGNDVYFKGLDHNMPEAWVKGTLDGTKVNIPITYLGESADGPHYLGEYYGAKFLDVTLTYSSEFDWYSTNRPIMINSKPEGLDYRYYYSNFNMGELPQPVAPPEGLETTNLPFNARSFDGSKWNDVSTMVSMGVDGDDVYIRGFMSVLPEGWIKGKIQGDKLVFANAQYVGNHDYYGPIFACGFDGYMGLADFTFTIKKPGLYVSDCIIFENSKFDEMKFWFYYGEGAVIGFDDDINPVTLPDGLEAKEYPFKGTKYIEGSNVDFSQKVNVAVDGDDVYIQGINQYVPTSWIKGTKSADGKTVTFPIPQHLGIYNYMYPMYLIGANPENQQLEDVVFSYDASNDTYVLQNSALVNAEKYAVYFYTYYNAGSTIGDGSTRVDNVDVDTAGNTKYFDLQGRAVGADAKGVLIRQTTTNDGRLQVNKVIRK